MNNNATELSEADCDEWILRDVWTALEGAALVMGREPPKHARGPGDVSSRISDANVRKRFELFYDLLKRRNTMWKANPMDPLGIPFHGQHVLEGDRPRYGRRLVQPRHVIALALEKKFDVPAPLLEAFKDATPRGDQARILGNSQAQSTYTRVSTIPPREFSDDANYFEASCIGVATSAPWVDTTPGLSGEVQYMGSEQIEPRGAIDGPHADDGTKSTGLPRKKILRADWPLYGKFTQDSLDRALSDTPKWLRPAQGLQGAPGKASSLWDPVLLAVCLCDRSYMKPGAVTPFMRKHYPEYSARWEEKKEELEW